VIRGPPLRKGGGVVKGILNPEEMMERTQFSSDILAHACWNWLKRPPTAVVRGSFPFGVDEGHVENPFFFGRI
jgi:hypothetical protein